MLLGRRELDNSWLLAPNRSVEGTRLATVRLRPLCAALLVPENDTMAAAAAVESCCVSWGGFANCIVPYSSSDGIREPWRRIVEVLDPDLFVCFDDAPPDEVEGYLRSLGEHCLFSYRSYERETLVTGTLVYSTLDTFMNPRDDERKSRTLVLPRYKGYPNESLPFLARYGSMLETTGYRNEKVVRHLPARKAASLAVNHRDFFDVRECQAGDHYHHEVPKMLSEVFVGDLGRLLPGEEDVDAPYATLPARTLEGVNPMTVGLWGNPGSLSELRKHASRVVVLGDYPSVEDLAFFWTLRGQRPGSYPFPVWVPYRHVYGERRKDLIETASQKLVERGRGGGGRLHITSASLDLEYMEDELREMFPNANITNDIEDFIGGTTYYYAVEQQQPVTFGSGTAYVQRIRPPQMESLEPDLDYVVHEVEIEGVKLPAVKSVERAIGGAGGWGTRITAGGAIRNIDLHKRTYSGKDFLEIRLPDGWGLLKAFFEHYGYACRQTNESSAALGQMRLLGGVEGINVVANSKVYEAIKGLCETEEQEWDDKRKRRYRADRRAVAYNYFTDVFGGSRNAQPILRWLIENRILLRGAEIECRRCKLEQWYEVNRIGERWRCDGCGEEMPIPVGPDALHWLYRVNELWANGQDQGSVTPLLALHAMHAKWGSSFAREGFGYHPGIKLEKRDEASVPINSIEIDLVALWGTKPILVECKESAEYLHDDPEQANKFAGQLAKQVKVAQHIDAHRLIVASPSRFPEDKTSLTGQVPEGSAVEIEWWDKGTLLDPLFSVAGFKASNPERLHLAQLVQTLTAHLER